MSTQESQESVILGNPDAGPSFENRQESVPSNQPQLQGEGPGEPGDPSNSIQLEDPRTDKNWDLEAWLEEGKSILLGGVQDTASSIATFPERTVDALSGEMAREREEVGYYRPEWHPFTDYENPIITKTWWGQLARGVVHFGTMAAGIILAAKAAPVTVPAGLTSLGYWGLIRAAGIGAVSDLISKESDGQNALGTLRDQYGFIDTPLSTRETDHPIMLKFKNIVEGMGVGVIFDGAAMLIGKGKRSVVNQIRNRNASIENQIDDAAIAQLRALETEFRADKNRPVADAHQGAHISEQDVGDAWEANQRIKNDWGAEEGSSGSVTTPVQRERAARSSKESAKVVDQVLRRLLTSEKYKFAVEYAKKNNITLKELYGHSVALHQSITLGRNAADMSSEEYLKELLDQTRLQPILEPDENNILRVTGQQRVWLEQNVAAVDLVVGTLLHQLRDTGISGRELMGLVDVNDIDGPTKQIVDTMLFALTEVKRSRMTGSANLRAMQDPDLTIQARNILKEEAEAALERDMIETRETIATILDITRKDKDGELLTALYEAFSQMNTVHSLDDFDRWARKMIKGGKIDPNKPGQTGVLIRELEGVMAHSILSGPKTPLRAVMGTSTATFLRPLATALGATMSYPFNGDATTMRAALASLNGMMQAIPESFDLFKSKLNSYWSGDVSNINSRYMTITRADSNWEILRRWAEDSGRATNAEKAMFQAANMARSMNNSNFLTYSTKLMAATDDAFAFILGRGKMREKALRNVLELEAAGKNIPEITPALLRKYEDDFYDEVFDGIGGIKDEATQFARKEVTLTLPLTGLSKGLNDLFVKYPLIQPFFKFARTGVNGLSLTAKHTPGLNFLLEEFNTIARATPDNLEEVAQYGIKNAAELANAQALQRGRLAMGSAVISMGIYSYLSGNITGNGPVNRTQRQAWLDAQWVPRSIKIGDVWVGYDSIEPFNQIFAIIADVGDASVLMGETWTEDEYMKLALVAAQGFTSKSYLAGMQQLVDLMAGRPGQTNRIIGNLTNNQIPLAGLRNELGKLFTPYTRELSSGVIDSWRNRNLISESFTGNQLPIKYDLLNGQPVRDHDPLTRFFNAISPIQFNLDHSAGRQLLFDSGYPLRMSVLSSPTDPTLDLSDSPVIRSMFQQAIGNQNLQAELDKLAKDPKIIASINEMYAVINRGERGNYKPFDFYHNRVLHELFTNARKIAWNEIKDQQEVVDLKRSTITGLTDRREMLESTTELVPSTAPGLTRSDLLNMYK